MCGDRELDGEKGGRDRGRQDSSFRGLHVAGRTDDHGAASLALAVRSDSGRGYECGAGSRAADFWEDDRLVGGFCDQLYAVGVGSAVGLLGRFLWAYIRTEAVNAEIRKATVGFADGQIIFRQGESSDKFFIIRSGQVVLTREANGASSEIAKAGPGEVVGEMGVLQGLSRSATATAKGKCWLYGMTAQDLMDKRSDGQDHPGSVVARVLAQRLRKSMEKSEQGQGMAIAQTPVAPQAGRPAHVAPVQQKIGPKLLLRMGWRKGDQVQWADGVSEHQLPLVFGRAPGPSGVSADVEMILLEENPPQWLSPCQFRVEVEGGTVVLKDEESPRGNEISGISVGPSNGLTRVELPAGQHVLIAGGEGSPYVMVLEIPGVQ